MADGLLVPVCRRKNAFWAFLGIFLSSTTCSGCYELLECDAYPHMLATELAHNNKSKKSCDRRNPNRRTAASCPRCVKVKSIALRQTTSRLKKRYTGYTAGHCFTLSKTFSTHNAIKNMAKSKRNMIFSSKSNAGQPSIHSIFATLDAQRLFSCVTRSVDALILFKR